MALSSDLPLPSPSQNHELLAEGELNGVGESDRVKELSDKVADLKAEVRSRSPALSSAAGRRQRRRGLRSCAVLLGGGLVIVCDAVWRKLLAGAAS